MKSTTDETFSTLNTDSSGDTFVKFQRLGSALTDAIIQCVILFKQSPVPGKIKYPK